MLLQNKKIVFWAKMGVLVSLLAYVAYATTRQPFDFSVIGRALGRTQNPVWWGLLLVLLTPVNWGFEAFKWQVLVRRVERVSFRDAYRGVLAGLALGMAIPTGIGDTVGRVLSLQTKRRADSVGAALVSGGMQFYIATVMGAVAWTIHLMRMPERDSPAARGLAVGLWILAGLGVVLALFRRSLVDWSGRWAFARRFSHYWAVAGHYTGAEMGTAFGAATLRYLTFSAQFLIVLHLYGLSLPVPDLLAGVGLVFLVKTITPAFDWLSDLGVREAAALWVFGPYNLPAPILVASTLTLWVVNILAPVLVGVVSVWHLRLTGTRPA
ncbi:MAG: flippase-like domain-containing protein [Rudanella sp.]|nr:flippase-like domain-containing protein [Rudanella sp.]